MSNKMGDFCRQQAYANAHEFHGRELSGYATKAAVETLLRSWLGALGDGNTDAPLRDLDEVIIRLH